MAEYDVAVAVFLRVEGGDETDAAIGAKYAVRHALFAASTPDEHGNATLPVVVLGKDHGQAKLAKVDEIRGGDQFVLRPSTQVFRSMNERECKTGD
jgi:hypothetical protein